MRCTARRRGHALSVSEVEMPSGRDPCQALCGDLFRSAEWVCCGVGYSFAPGFEDTMGSAMGVPNIGEKCSRTVESRSITSTRSGSGQVPMEQCKEKIEVADARQLEGFLGFLGFLCMSTLRLGRYLRVRIQGVIWCAQINDDHSTVLHLTPTVGLGEAVAEWSSGVGIACSNLFLRGAGTATSCHALH